MDESKLSQALKSIAGSVSPASADERLVRRAKRRVARSVVAGAFIGAILIGGGIFGADLLMEREVAIDRRAVLASVVTSADGALECTATASSPIVQPGDLTGVRMTLRNVSPQAVMLGGQRYGQVAVRDEHGNVLLTSADLEGPRGIKGEQVRPPELAAGESRSVVFFDVRVRWAGHLQVVPTCLGREMESLDIDVAVPGSAPEPDQALASALEASSGLFASCSPAVDGSWVTGVIEAPYDEITKEELSDEVPPMTARCSAVIDKSSGFTIVALRFVAPATAPEIEFPGNMGDITLPGDDPISVVRWTFLATVDGVKEIEPLFGAGRTRAGPGRYFGIAHWTRGWTLQTEGQCGGEGMGNEIRFFTRCPG